ncbi:MAG: hydroxymethylglutaryl-CoA reductase [Calditrichaeota bacterium]|nr:MAG: hydroxymethylglutaryl-CoA reductase [Calditrichota bacterium]
MSDPRHLAAAIPMQKIGPIKIYGSVIEAKVLVPLATFESPVWPSTNRGARVTAQSGGIQVTIIDERMTRSIVMEAMDAKSALAARDSLTMRTQEIREVCENTSNFARLLDIHYQIIANLLYIRLEMSTGDASGHNMVTKAADALMEWILEEYQYLHYISVSGNFCTDKKVSAVNGILGRGKNVIAETWISDKLCRRYLKTAPDKIVDINIKKNLYGSIIAGGLRSANAHFANMLLAFYLATGQDAANIIEGSQGFVNAEVRENYLYFAVTLPNIIVGTVGSGKGLDFVDENLRDLGCRENRPPGENGRRLAAIAAATVLCGELSLLAALTNPGELMRTHESLERA